MRWQVLLLTAMSITLALSLLSCGPPSGLGQGIKHGEVMQGAIKLPRGVPSGMGRELEALGEEVTAIKIKDKTKQLGDKLLKQALDNGPEALEVYQRVDSDLDGQFDGGDNCPDVFNGRQQDSDGDGNGDVCDVDAYPVLDVDADRDSVEDSIDNCPTVWNWSQVDLDLDDYGDACDSDMDGDDELYTSDPDNDGDGVVNAYDHFDWYPAYY